MNAFGFYSKVTVSDVMRVQPVYELFADMDEETKAGSVTRTLVAEAFPSVGHRMVPSAFHPKPMLAPIRRSLHFARLIPNVTFVLQHTFQKDLADSPT